MVLIPNLFGFHVPVSVNMYVDFIVLLLYNGEEPLCLRAMEHQLFWHYGKAGGVFISPSLTGPRCHYLLQLVAHILCKPFDFITAGAVRCNAVFLSNLVP